MKTKTNDNSITEELSRCITWQYDQATNLVGLINMLKDWFDQSTGSVWDAWKNKVEDIATADDFGLAVWGKILGCDRPILTIGGSSQNLSTATYRKLLKARAQLLASHATVPDYQQYIATAFDGHFVVSDGNDMGITFMATASATAEESALASQFPDIAFLWPAGARSSYVTPEGTFGLYGSDYVPTFDNNIMYAPIDPLKFTAQVPGVTVSFTSFGSTSAYTSIPELVYSLDGFTWNDYEIRAFSDPDKMILTLTNIGDSVYFKAKNRNDTFSISMQKYFKFTVIGQSSCSGDVISLLSIKEEVPLSNYCFTSLFKSIGRGADAYPCDITSLPRLRSKTLAEGCYSIMFEKNAYITETLPLEATELAAYCFYSMYSYCDNLSYIHPLPCTTLAPNCYNGMFYGCTSLTSIPDLPALNMAENCYCEMFRYCSAITTLPVLRSVNLAKGCYYGMLGGTGITDYPNLPAEELKDTCYSYMFSGCLGLTRFPELPITTLAGGCYMGMFARCTNISGEIGLPATTMAVDCYSYMFEGCTSMTTPPVLSHITELADGCFEGMFKDSGITYAPVIPDLELKPGCFSFMFAGTGITTAPQLPTSSILPDRCYRGMFHQCAELESCPTLNITSIGIGTCYGMFWKCSKLTPPIPSFNSVTRIGDSGCIRMFSECPLLAVNTSGPGQAWKVPTQATTGSSWNLNMFIGTSGTFTGNPVKGTTYYIASAS